MNTTANASDGLSFGLTYPERYSQFAFYLFFGSTAFIGNSMMAIGIAKCKEMRSRFYVIIIFLLMARMLMCMQLLQLAIYRFLRVLDKVAFPSRLVCGFLTVFVYPGTLELLVLLVLAIDRAIALFAVAYYRHLKWQQAAKMCAVVSLIPLAVKIGLLVGDPPIMSTVSCFNVFDSVATANATLSQNLDLALLIVLIAVYVLILVVLRFRLHKLRNSPENDAGLVAIRRHLTLMPTVRNIIVVHCVWTLSAKVLITLALEPFAESLSAKFLLYAGYFVASELLVNVIILLWTNLDVRRATFSLYSAQKVGAKAPSSTGQGVSASVGRSPDVPIRATTTAFVRNQRLISHNL